ncbi:MAG: PLP-dependent aminotransferase family protein [Myxococcota bacterium]
MWLSLDGNGALYRQTYRALRQAILDGQLAAGAQLPSSRTLAEELQVARNTVLQAYEQLVAEGYAVPRRGAGTFVASELPDAPPPAQSERPNDDQAAPRLSVFGERGAALFGNRLGWGRRRPTPRYDFRYGEPAFDDFPHATWCRLLARRARRASERHLSYSEPGGAPELREALAGYLARTRGVVCDAASVLVVYGTQQAIDLTARVLLDPGDRAIVEEPGYPGIRNALAMNGAEVVPARVDAEGIVVDDIADTSARLACVTPSHQFPLGGVMPLGRRLALLDWAERVDAVVLEDDYDGEFRYDGRPLESLRALDRRGRVLYVGTTSKVMFPSLRIAYLVLPEALRPAFFAAKAFADTGTAHLEQRVLADFIDQGFFERHLRRARVRNAARRAALLEALTDEIGSDVEVVGENSGLHLVAWLDRVKPGDLRTLRELAARRDVGIHPVTPFYTQRPTRAGIILGYAALDEAAIREGIGRLAEALRELRAL